MTPELFLDDEMDKLANLVHDRLSRQLSNLMWLRLRARTDPLHGPLRGQLMGPLGELLEELEEA